MNPKWKRPRKRGLGDVVETVAEPIAAVIDFVFHTNIKGCSGCQKRKESLNELVPFDRDR
jgi:hypothetical protein